MMQQTKQQQAIYNMMARWQQMCLLKDGSLWTDEALWTKQQLRELLERLAQSEARAFNEKWQTALAATDKALHALLLEAVYIYYVFPTEAAVRYDTKVRQLNAIVTAGGLSEIPDTTYALLQHGVGYTDARYSTRKYDEVRYILAFAYACKTLPMKKRRALLQSPWESLKRLLIEVRQTIGKDVHMQHVLAHLIAPTYYERIASGTDKLRIVEAFKHYLKHEEEDVDRQLYDIRQELSQQLTHVDFYEPPLVTRWQQPPPVVAEQQTTYTPFAHLELQGLIFEQQERLRMQIQTALKSGKHIIFTGPPGSGKSTLATRVCEELQQRYMRVTATANWSAYDTIGGYRPTRTGELAFHPGIFLQALKPHEQWLIIDELNRANIDEAFGPLFSVLTGDAVTLPYTAANGELVTISSNEAVADVEHMYTVSKQWRIIGTMNTRDKAALFDVSYAFMRRFAFIPVPIPQQITTPLMQQYLHVWALADDQAAMFASLWQTINDMHPIGPAIIEDVVRYVMMSGDEDVTSALQLYIIPRLEGVASDFVERWLSVLAQSFAQVIDVPTLRRFCHDFLQMGRDYE